MADEIRTVASVQITADEQAAAEAGKRDARAYSDALREEIERATANITPRSGVLTQQNLISQLPGRGELNDASALNVAQSRLARSYIDLAVANGDIDAKQAAQITRLLRAYEQVESGQLKVAAESDKQARAIAEQTQKITRAQEIFAQNNTSEEAIRQLEATRQANSRLQSTLSEQRRVELNQPGTSSARRFALDLGGNSLLQSEAGTFDGSPLLNELKKGFLGTRQPGDSGSFGASIGQVGRFTALYGGAYSALFKVTQEFGNATREALAFQDAIEQLNIATGKSTEDNAQLADSLGSVAVAAGQAPSAGVSAGAQAIGLYDVAQSSSSVQSQTALTSVGVSARIATLGGTSIESTQQDLASLARSLNLSVQQLPALEDSLTFISKSVGRPVSEILPAVAQIGTIGAGAGFSQSELAAAVARVASTTGAGVSGGAASLRQVFSRSDDVNFQQKLLEQFGISSQGKTLKDIFAEFAQSNPSTDRVNQFSLLFGRGASQQAAQILATQFPKIESLAAGADQAAGTGLGKEQFDAIMQGFGEQIKLLGAQILELGKDLANTGILDFLALFVKGAIELAKALDQVVKIFNEIPRPVRSAVFGLIELKLAITALSSLQGLLKGVTVAGLGARAAGGLPLVGGTIAGNLEQRQIANAVANALGDAEGNVAVRAAAGGGLLGRGRVALNDLNRASSFGNVGGFLGRAGSGAVGLGRGALGSLGSALGASEGAAVATGAVAAVVGVAAVIAVGVIKNLVELSAVQNAINDGALKVAQARSPEELQAAVETARTTNQRAQGLTDAPIFSLQTLTGQTALNALNITGARDEQKQAQAQQAYAEELQRRVTAARAAAQGQYGAQAGLTDFSSVAALDAQVKALGTSGFTAAQQLDAVNTAMNAVANSSNLAAQGVKASLNASDAATLGIFGGASANAALQSTIQFAGEKRTAGQGGLGFLGDTAATDAYRSQIDILNKIDPQKLQDSVQSALDSQAANLPRGANGELNLTGDQEKSLEETARKAAEAILPPGLTDEVKKQLLTQVVAGVRAQFAKNTVGTDPNQRFDSLLAGAQEEAQNFGTFAASKALLPGQTSASGQKATLADLDQQIAQLKANNPATARDGGYFTDPANDQKIQQLEETRLTIFRQYVQQQQQENQIFAAAKQARLKADDVLGSDAINIGALQQNLALAKQGGDPVAIAQATTALLQAQQKQAKDAIDAANVNQLAGIDPRNQAKLLATQLAQAKAKLAGETPGSSEYGQTRQQIAQLQQQQAQYAVGTLNAQQEAGVAGNSSAIAQATVSVDVAKRNLGLTLKGTQEYYQALGALRQAQAQLGDAELAYASDLRKLNSDLTDPVAQAQNAVKDAQAKLAHDRQTGQGKDVIAADQVSLKNAQNQAEAAAFSQRLSDAQIADQLGRTSHEAYIKYLQSEHDRLTNIAHRTRQQQDELNQIDQALQAANQQLSGQFNLGDIKVPTPYEVRRYIATTASAATSGAAAAQFSAALGGNAPAPGSTVNNISIDGADTAAVEKILRQILGTSAIGSATTVGRKT